MKGIRLNPVDKIEILTLEDNYIDIVPGDDSSIITRATTSKGDKRMSVLAEHGFSALVKTSSDSGARTMLLDFGFSHDVVVRNAEALGVDFNEVEALALSHGHVDHQGGLFGIADAIEKKGLELIVHPVVFRQNRYRYGGGGKKVPIPSLTKAEVEKTGLVVVETKEVYPMLDGDVLFLGEIPRRTSFEKGMPNTYYEENHKEFRDHIEDDSSIVMNLKDKGLVIVSGCAHAGIINTVEYAKEVTGVEKVHVVMGGFHLTGPDFEHIIDITVDCFRKINPDYIVPTHCTGRKASRAIETAFPGCLLLNMSGTKLTFA